MKKQIKTVSQNKKSKKQTKKSFLKKIKKEIQITPEQFLEGIRIGTRDLKSGEIQPAHKHAYFLLYQFRKNYESRYCLSREIFKVGCDDQNGFVYWKCWYDKDCLNVELFAHIIAVHSAAEYSDEFFLKTSSNQMIGRSPSEFYATRKGEVISKILEAARMNRAGDTLPFQGDVDALRVTNTESMKRQAWSWEGNILKSLRGVFIKPSYVLEWFFKVPERAELLPKTLHIWLINKLQKKDSHQETIKEKKEINDNEIENYIAEQRKQGKEEAIIAYELYDKKGPFGLTCLAVARKFKLSEGLNEDQITTLKKRGHRLIQKGQKILKK